MGAAYSPLHPLHFGGRLLDMCVCVCELLCLNLSFIHGIIIKIIFDFDKPNENFTLVQVAIPGQESGSQGGEKYHLPTRPVGQARPLTYLTSSSPPARRSALHFSAHCASLFVILFLGWLFFHSVWVNSKFFTVPGRWSASTLRWLMD